ncbi:MAG: Abi family protein [Candidatus Margulisbacteria bacterium]|jgi:abortive infection bacteriophage resistance protein|nr:Abi family protein [Candidatus Margulisiibacteriota bacterium]
MKQPNTYIQQIEKLRSRGCMIPDVDFCKEVLANINYYRLSAYFLPYKTTNDKYLPNTNFNTIYQIYEFDRKLRALLFLAIEEVEITLRARLAYFHANKYGALGYKDAKNFNIRHRHEKFIERINTVINDNKKVLFVRHHNEKYVGNFPIWVIIELFTFGMLSYFYADLPTANQKIIAREIFQAVPKTLISWLRCCTDLRNICAHSGRLYYRIFTAIPSGLTTVPQDAERRLFGAVMSLQALYLDAQKWNIEIYPALCVLLKEYAQDINLKHIGFSENWEVTLRKS